MMHHATTDADGYATGFHLPGISPAIPDGAIPLPPETYEAWIADTQGQRWQDGALVPAPHRLPVVSMEQQAAAARARRDAWLAASDWTQLADAPMNPEAQAAWRAYRAALRALPNEKGFPAEIAWPEPPPAAIR